MRDQRIEALIGALDRVLSARLQPGGDEWPVWRGIVAALQSPRPASPKPDGKRLGATTLLAEALDIPRQHDGDLAPVADCVAALAPDLEWWSRLGSVDDPTGFVDGHSFIVGPGALEDRDDAEIGVSLLAPNVRYPDHHHPPAEVYLSLTPGIWRKGDGSWVEPGIGGTVFNAPNDVHAMRSEDLPLFAFWCLLLK